MARWLSKTLALLALALWTASVVDAFEERIVRVLRAWPAVSAAVDPLPDRIR